MNVKDIKNLKRIWAFEGNFARFENTEGKTGLINRQGEVIFPADKYEYGNLVKDGIFNFQVIDSKIPAIYFDANLRKEVEKPNMQVTPKPELPEFTQKLDGAYWCAPNRIAFKENDLWGIMDETGKILVKPQYIRIGYAAPYGFKNDRISVKNQEDKVGYIDLDGKVLVPCENQFMVWCRKIGVYKFEPVVGKWGLLNADGKVIIPAIYDSIDAGEEKGLNEIAVSKDGRCYFINEKQEEVKVF